MEINTEINPNNLIPDVWNITDLSYLMFSLCKISDKRNLIRTSKRNYLFTLQMRKYEKQFKKLINKGGMLDDSRFTQLDDLLYKHTLELIHDDNYHLIPDRYYCQRNRILCMYSGIYKKVAYRGNLDMLQKMSNIKYTQNRKNNYEQMSYGAALGGHIHILNWITSYPNNNELGFYITRYAAKSCQFELLQKLINDGHKIHESTIEYSVRGALKSNNTEILNWLLFEKNLIFYIDSITYVAVQKNRLDIIELLENRFGKCGLNICDVSIELGNIEMLKWGLLHNYEIRRTSYSDPVRGGNVLILEWLIKNAYIKEKTPILSKNAAIAGNLEVLEWCKKNDFPFDIYIDENYKNFKILKWLVENCCKINYGTILKILQYGNKKMIKLLLKIETDLRTHNMIL